MSTYPYHVYRLWALVLSLTVHLVLLCITGVRGDFAYSVESNVNKTMEISTVTLREGASATSDILLGDEVKPKRRPRNRSVENALAGKQVAKRPSVIFEVSAMQEPYYFKSSELEEKPEVLTDISADLAHRLTGELPQSGILRLLINERGEIDQVVIDESGFSEENQQLVREAFAKMKFRPGKFGDNPVKSELKIEITLENIVTIPYSK